MPRIKPLESHEVPPDVKRIYDRQIADHGRMTNMKKTLGHSGPALSAYMEWYTLRQEVLPFLGERLTVLFAHAVSTETDCLICGTFFRRLLIDAGEDPDHLVLDPREQLVVDFGRQLAKNAWGVSDDMFAQLWEHFEPAQIVALTAFGGLMIATNIFNNALRVELDEYLWPYRAQEK